MHSRTSRAGNDLIHLVVLGLFFVRPAVLNVQTSSRTSKNEVGHRPTLARVTAYVLTDINIATQPKCPTSPVFHLFTCWPRTSMEGALSRSASNQRTRAAACPPPRIGIRRGRSNEISLEIANVAFGSISDKSLLLPARDRDGVADLE